MSYLHVVCWVPYTAQRTPLPLHPECLFPWKALLCGLYLKSAPCQKQCSPEMLTKASCTVPRDNLVRIPQHRQNKKSFKIWEMRPEGTCHPQSQMPICASYSTPSDAGGQKQCLTHASLFSGQCPAPTLVGQASLCYSISVLSLPLQCLSTLRPGM